MPTLPLADCTCDNVCPTAANCTCIAVIGPTSTRCCCDCSSTPIALPVVIKAEDEVSVNVRNTELAEVAAFIHRVTDIDLLVPVSRLREQVTVGFGGVTFAEALNELGLALPPPREEGY